MANTINFTQTRNIEALPLSTSTPEEVAAFLAPTLYAFHHAPALDAASIYASPENIGSTLAGVLHKKGQGVSSAGRTYAYRDAYLVKIDGIFHPSAVRPQNMERLFGIVL